jgi:hypothetical protein
MRAGVLWTVLVVGAVGLGAEARDARACGGCFNRPPAPSMTATVVTDHRMIFSVSPSQTTLYDQIKYTGSPSDFAWVLPIKGVVTVGISSDALFAALDSLTTTTIVAPPSACPPPPSCPCCNCFALGGVGASSIGSNPPVTILSQSTVGPYEQVQLQSTDPTALESWLSSHGYQLPANVQPVVAAYVNEGFDFLAIKLVPGSGVQAMRPISVTTPGAGLTLPLRMVAAGAGSTVGITLWVIGSGRYEPANFSWFTISPGQLTWDFSTMMSDYATLRTQAEALSGFAAWQVESSLYVGVRQVEQVLLYGATGVVDAGSQYSPVYGDGGADAGDSGIIETADQARIADLETCFPGSQATHVTRMRADLAQSALASDLVLQAATDQSVLSNVYQVTQSINGPECTTYPPLSCAPCNYPNGGDTSYGSYGYDAGAPTQAGPTAGGSGCSSVSTSGDAATLWPELAVVGLLGAGVWRARRKKS